MGINYNPRTVTDGLVLALDAGSPKNYNLTAVEVLVVAGGGGGAGDVGGAGGAGGLVYNRNFAVTPGSALTVTVGGGGTGRVPFETSAGGSGGNSVFGSITATGGGGGGNYPSGSGTTGGSGGGGSNSGSGGAGTSGQGFAGGSGVGGGPGGFSSAGGGGAGEVGKNGTSASPPVGGNGGNGLFFGQFSSVGGFPAGWFAGGGGGGGGDDSGSDGRGFGGLGGGGTGASRSGTYATNSSFRNAVANTGGGGGGTGGWNTAGNGGSGIVIVRYPGPQKAIGGTITSINGDTIHTFTTVGSTTFTPLVATNNSAVLGLSDLSGRGNFGTTANSPTYSSANGGSIVFDGSNDYVQTPITGTYTQISFDFWGFFDDPTLSTTSRDESAFGDWNSNRVHFGTRWSVGMHFNVNGIWQTTPATNLRYGWNHYVLVYDTVSNQKLVYLNGILSSSNVTNGNMVLGDFKLGVATALNAYYRGNISNFKIYNRALTAAEISQNFNALKSRYI